MIVMDQCWKVDQIIRLGARIIWSNVRVREAITSLINQPTFLQARSNVLLEHRNINILMLEKNERI